VEKYAFKVLAGHPSYSVDKGSLLFFVIKSLDVSEMNLMKGYSLLSIIRLKFLELQIMTFAGIAYNEKKVSEKTELDPWGLWN
jgi:hypothetical protein